MKNAATEISVEEIVKPATKFEATLLRDRELIAGLHWGTPRFGHPEGKVVYHIAEVMENVEQLPVDASIKEQLRIVSIVHDSFKYMEDKITFPRDWSKHHGKYARKFFEKYSDNKDLLDLIELHDEAYYCWRLAVLKKDPKSSQHRMNSLMARLNGNMQLFYLFFKCDTMTGDKNLAPLKWFEDSITNIQIVDLIR